MSCSLLRTSQLRISSWDQVHAVSVERNARPIATSDPQGNRRSVAIQPCDGDLALSFSTQSYCQERKAMVEGL
jgi:hypothetical protein